MTPIKLIRDTLALPFLWLAVTFTWFHNLVSSNRSEVIVYTQMCDYHWELESRVEGVKYQLEIVLSTPNLRANEKRIQNDPRTIR